MKTEGVEVFQRGRLGVSGRGCSGRIERAAGAEGAERKRLFEGTEVEGVGRHPRLEGKLVSRGLEGG